MVVGSFIWLASRGKGEHKRWYCVSVTLVVCVLRCFVYLCFLPLILFLQSGQLGLDFSSCRFLLLILFDRCVCMLSSSSLYYSSRIVLRLNSLLFLIPLFYGSIKGVSIVLFV